MASRTFKLDSPRMEGEDVAAWQCELRDRFAKWDIDYPVKINGEYDLATRSATASFMRAWGVENVGDAMKEGLTPWWRTKLREDRRHSIERAMFGARKGYRSALRDRYERIDVAPPLAKILEDSWGYHPPVHDGVDLICLPNAPLMAICDAEVIRADAGGWWGKGAPAPAVAAKGDGIIVLRSLTDTGPFEKGLNFAYGHAEHPVVRVGQRVRAGDLIGKAGLANAWHVHFMVNGRDDAKGVGDRDPRVFLDYANAAR